MNTDERSPGGVIYEVDFEAEAAIDAPFDTWLRDHIADVLQFKGFQSAEIFDGSATEPGRIRRIVQYRVRSRGELEDFLGEQARAIYAQGVALLGERFTVQERTLHHREELVHGAVSTENCLNCGEVLTGQHCSHCGQRASVRVLSLWGLLKELFGDLTEWDSRVWRTLRPLAFKPGFLTVDYLRGRRARYTPPFRMYLILSLGFFLLTSLNSDIVDVNVEPGDLDTGINFSIDASEPPGVTPEGAESATEKTEPPAEIKLDPATRQLVDQIIERVPEEDRQRVMADLQEELAGLTPEQLEATKKVLKNPCSEENFKLELGPGTEAFETRLREACQKIVADGKGFGTALLENIPKMMFVFLPLIALVMYLLYIGSGRYYVEHLLFFVHFHSFFFLAGICIQLMLQGKRLTSGEPSHLFEVAAEALTAALVLYAPYYLYRAMRRVYQQGRIATLVRYSALVIAYIVSLALTGIGLLVYTALML